MRVRQAAFAGLLVWTSSASLAGADETPGGPPPGLL
jgi:hypothetical protein